MSYQGHLADGSSVQKHSAGAFYPFVLQLRGDHFAEIIGPGIPGALRFGDMSAPAKGSQREAIRDAQYAAGRLVAVRENPDAWAFELEQLMSPFGQKLPAMRRYAEVIEAECGTARWADMSKLRRGWALLALGACFNTQHRILLAGATRPNFARFALRWLGETR